MTIVLSESRPWLSTDSIVSVATEATNAPASALKSMDLGDLYRDTSAATSNGFRWNYNGSSVSAWAFCVLGINDAGATPGRGYRLRLDDVSPFTGSSPTLVTSTISYSLSTTYGILGTPDMERIDTMFCCGIDAGPTVPTVTGAPNAFAHLSGEFWWIHAGGSHQDGYHQARALVIGINPLVFPEPNAWDYKRVELRRGHGWEVTMGWTFLPETAASGVSGGTELDHLIGATRRRPIVALLDTAGMTSGGVPNNTKPSRWRRLGACRIVPQDQSSSWLAAAGGDRYERTLTLRTWEEEADGAG